MKMEKDVEETCLHELPLGQCSICKAPPPGINKIVYITKGGNTFHNITYCAKLSAGQAEAEIKDLNIHAIEPVSYSSVSISRKPCKNCCTLK
jgi:hypothetical protein